MKVVIRQREDGTFDCHIKRTRTTEGKSKRGKGLSKEALHAYLVAEIPTVSDVEPRKQPA